MDERGLIILSEKKWLFAIFLIVGILFLAYFNWFIPYLNGTSTITSLLFVGSLIALVLHLLGVSLSVVALSLGFKEDWENWRFNKRFYLS